jgi:hypothetical protein
MLPSRRKEGAAAILLLVALGPGTGLVAGPAGPGGNAVEKEGPAAGLTLAEYERLKPILDIKNQPWATIPWKYSITEARRLAAATRKPIFMVVNTGNALGCT